MLTSISILLVKTPYLNTFQAVVLLRTITPNGNRATKQNPDSSFALFLSEVSFANTENLHGCKRSEGNILFLSNITTHSQTLTIHSLASKILIVFFYLIRVLKYLSMYRRKAYRVWFTFSWPNDCNFFFFSYAPTKAMRINNCKNSIEGIKISILEKDDLGNLSNF